MLEVIVIMSLATWGHSGILAKTVLSKPVGGGWQTYTITNKPPLPPAGCQGRPRNPTYTYFKMRLIYEFMVENTSAATTNALRSEEIPNLLFQCIQYKLKSAKEKSIGAQILCY